MSAAPMERVEASGKECPTEYAWAGTAIGRLSLAVPRPTNATSPGALYHAVKRALDIAGALVGLLILALAFPAIALCIVLDDGMPIIYRREAVGLGGRRFRVLKFRSMRRDADEYLRRHSE